MRLGEFGGGITPRLERVGALWQQGGFKVLLFPDIHRMIWEKFICNVAFSGTCAVTGLRVGEVLANPDAFDIAARCATEAFLVARAKGITVEIEDPVHYVRAFGEKIPGARPSMLLDHLAGRRSEIDVLNGAVPPLATAVGQAAPVNTVVAGLVRAKESAFSPSASV